MNRDPHLPLTETFYYVLLALLQPAHGYLIMSRVEEMSGGQVRLAPGTLYGALDNLGKQKLIIRVPSDDPRRKVYQITEQGLGYLDAKAREWQHTKAVVDRFTEGIDS